MLHLVNDARPGVAAHVVTFLGLAAVAGTACRVMLAPMADNGDRVVAAAVRLAAMLRFSAEEEAAGEEWSAPPTPTPTPPLPISTLSRKNQAFFSGKSWSTTVKGI